MLWVGCERAKTFHALHCKATAISHFHNIEDQILNTFSPVEEFIESEPKVTSIFRVEELAEQETSVKADGKHRCRAWSVAVLRDMDSRFCRERSWGEYLDLRDRINVAEGHSSPSTVSVVTSRRMIRRLPALSLTWQLFSRSYSYGFFWNWYLALHVTGIGKLVFL